MKKDKKLFMQLEVENVSIGTFLRTYKLYDKDRLVGVFYPPKATIDIYITKTENKSIYEIAEELLGPDNLNNVECLDPNNMKGYEQLNVTVEFLSSTSEDKESKSRLFLCNDLLMYSNLHEDDIKSIKINKYYNCNTNISFFDLLRNMDDLPLKDVVHSSTLEHFVIDYMDEENLSFVYTVTTPDGKKRLYILW